MSTAATGNGHLSVHGLGRVWIVLLLGPLAWSASLGLMYWLAHPVCQGKPRLIIFTAGGVCGALALAAGLLARRELNAATDAPAYVSFLLRMAMGCSAIFVLVIALSLVPVGLLSPCGI
jgi:hypothetical protein